MTFLSYQTALLYLLMAQLTWEGILASSLFRRRDISNSNMNNHHRDAAPAKESVFGNRNHKKRSGSSEIIVAFHYGPFDNHYIESDVESAAQNGKFYADLPSGTATESQFGTTTVDSATSDQTQFSWTAPDLPDGAQSWVAEVLIV